MKSNGILLLSVAVSALVLGPGCGAGKEEITERQRMEAAHLASEAEFAATLRDYARAEALFSQIVQLAPDTGSYWVSLGSMRVRLGDRARARESYQAALRAFTTEAGKEEADAEPWLDRVHTLALLGRIEEARKVLAQAAQRFPNDRHVRRFVEGEFERILENPEFKAMAL